MKNLRALYRIVVVIALFIVTYVPIELLWQQLLPTYSEFLSGLAERIANTVETRGSWYSIRVKGDDFVVEAFIVLPGNRSNQYSFDGTRPTNLVSYNLALWAALGIASAFFLNRKARWKFLLLAPLIVVAWHVCDLVIFAKNARWMLLQDLQRQDPHMVDYSAAWQWFWWWLFELNRRIIDPFLPLLLWILFCARSFFGGIGRKTPILAHSSAVPAYRK